MIAIALQELKITAWEASRKIGRVTGEQTKTVWMRLDRWLSGHAPKIEIVERDLRILGYEIQLVQLINQANQDEDTSPKIQRTQESTKNVEGKR